MPFFKGNWMRKIMLPFLFLSIVTCTLHSYDLVVPLRIVAHGTGMVFSGLITFGMGVGTMEMTRKVCIQKSMVLADKMWHTGTWMVCGSGLTYVSACITCYFYHGITKEIEQLKTVNFCD